MVVFTCNHCGDSLKRVAVEKHYSFGCRGAPIFLTCIDCLKDFDKSSFNNHTSCITEAEKYSGKGFVPKESKNLKKQEAFVEIVRRIQETNTEIGQGVRQILSLIADKDNLPRKRMNFIRYLQNSFKNLKEKDIENTWSVLEEAQKSNKQQQQPQQQKNDISSLPEQNGNNKRKLQHEETLQITNNEKQKLSEEASVIEISSKKMKPSVEDAEEDHNNTDVNIQETANDNGRFNWSETIKNILNSKNNEMKIKKLKKKVLNKYKKYSGLNDINEKIEKKFNKKITKLGLVVAEDNVRLIGH